MVIALSVAQHMTLRGLLALCILWLPDVQVEHVTFGVVVGMVEDVRADPDFTSRMLGVRRRLCESPNALG